jgi:hypothetical protein
MLADDSNYVIAISHETHTHTYIYIYVYVNVVISLSIYKCMYVFMYV